MEQYKVIPLCYNMINWNALGDIGKGFFDEPLNRVLDRRGIKTNDPGSLLAALTDNYYQYPDARLKHLFFLFAVEADSDLLAELSKVPLKCTTIAEKRNSALILLSGTMDQWYLAIKIGCSENAVTCLRMLMNQFHKIFCQSVIKDLWERTKIVSHADGTYIIL